MNEWTKCNNCGAIVSETIVRADGLPSGVSLVMRGGETITLCADCIVSIGRMSDKDKEEFFGRLKDNG